MTDQDTAPRPQSWLSGLRRPGAAIVVGYDGSAAADVAVRWAARDAVRRGARMRVVTGLDPGPLTGWSGADVGHWQRIATEQVDAAAGVARQIGQGQVIVDARALEGRPVDLLLEEAATAQELVIGSAGHLGVLGALTGSVSRKCAQQAQCPVVIVGPAARSDPVTRFVTSTVLDRDGLVSRWLQAELRHRPLPVLVVDSWNVNMQAPPNMFDEIPAVLRAEARRRHLIAIDRLRDTLPAGTRLSSAFREGHPADGLLLASRPGDLLLIPRSAVHDVSFTDEMCPVMVIPPAR